MRIIVFLLICLVIISCEIGDNEIFNMSIRALVDERVIRNESMINICYNDVLVDNDDLIVEYDGVKFVCSKCDSVSFDSPRLNLDRIFEAEKFGEIFLVVEYSLHYRNSYSIKSGYIKFLKSKDDELEFYDVSVGKTVD